MTHDTDTRENIAQTVAKIMEHNGAVDVMLPGTLDRSLAHPLLMSVPSGQTVQDFTANLRTAQSLLKPFTRKGTARMGDVESLIAWANRFKGETSVLFAQNEGEKLSLTCIADYHGSGGHSIEAMGDPTARHCQHRASYAFPLSKQWRAWLGISGNAKTGQEMGVFLEDNILDVIDPPQVLSFPGIAGAEATEAELRLIDIARRLEGKYGNGAQLLGMANSFSVYETSEFVEVRNTTTGEAKLQHKSEHQDGTGKPIDVPKLFLIAIPVFEGGHAYRLPVRFQYRKSGSSVKFILTLHDPKHALDHAFDEAVMQAAEMTELPLFIGQPEA